MGSPTIRWVSNVSDDMAVNYQIRVQVFDSLKSTLLAATPSEHTQTLWFNQMTLYFDVRMYGY